MPVFPNLVYCYTQSKPLFLLYSPPFNLTVQSFSSLTLVLQSSGHAPIDRLQTIPTRILLLLMAIIFYLSKHNIFKSLQIALYYKATMPVVSQFPIGTLLSQFNKREKNGKIKEAMIVITELGSGGGGPHCHSFCFASCEYVLPTLIVQSSSVLFITFTFHDDMPSLPLLIINHINMFSVPQSITASSQNPPLKPLNHHPSPRFF